MECSVDSCSRLSAHWLCPPSDDIKLNVDGAFSEVGEKVGLGFLARDFAGNFICAVSKTEWHDGSAEAVLTKALFWTISVAVERGWQEVIVESDCNFIIEDK